jgi:hypothetical protein
MEKYHCQSQCDKNSERKFLEIFLKFKWTVPRDFSPLVFHSKAPPPDPINPNLFLNGFFSSCQSKCKEILSIYIYFIYSTAGRPMDSFRESD